MPDEQGGADVRSRVDIGLIVNGERKRVSLDIRATLLDARRDGPGLTGTRKRVRKLPIRIEDLL